MLKFAVVLLAVFTLTTGAICGRGQREPKRLSDDEFRLHAYTAASSALLTITDFPPGWIGTPPETGGEDNPASLQALRSALSPDCQDDADVFWSGKHVGSASEVESDTFEPDADGPPNEISSNAATYRTEVSLSAEWARVATFYERCARELPEAMRLFLMADPETARAEALDVEFREVEAPDLGDRAMRVELSIEFLVEDTSVRFTIVATTIQAGRMVSTVQWTDFGNLDRNLAESLTRVVADRNIWLNEALPE